MIYRFTDVVIDSRTGLNPRKNFILGGGDNYYITIKDIYNGKVNFTDKSDKVDDEAIQIIKRRSRIKVGDILFVSIGRIGETAIVTSKDDSWDVNESVFVFTVNDRIITPEYFCIMFQSQGVKRYLSGNSSGSTFKSIKMNQLERMVFDLPPVAIQKDITAKLAAVKRIIDLRISQLAELDHLVKARFVELFGDPELNPFGWECLPLSTLVSVEPQNGLYKPQSDYVEDGSGIPILRIDAFYNGKVTDFQSLRRLICSDTERERYLLRENDIVINRVNSIEYLGKCAHIRGMLEDTVFESNMMRFHLNESIIDAGFAVHLLCTQYIYKQILNRAKKAVNQASINQGDVMSFQILVPPLALQKQFVTFIEQTDKSKFSCECGGKEAYYAVKYIWESLCRGTPT